LAIAQQLLSRLRVEVPYEHRSSTTSARFLRTGGRRWPDRARGLLPRPGLLDTLAARFSLAIFQGPFCRQAAITLRRYAPDIIFRRSSRPRMFGNGQSRPEGLGVDSRSRTRCQKMIYVGDTVDDARCSRAAGVPFIGIAAPSNPLHASWPRCSRRGRRGRARRCQSDRRSLGPMRSATIETNNPRDADPRLAEIEAKGPLRDLHRRAFLLDQHAGTFR